MKSVVLSLNMTGSITEPAFFENGIAVLNLSPSENGCTAEYADKMDRFLEKYQLHFVNWSAVSAVGCNRGSFIQLFEK